jgi:hypothetical protein
LRPGWQRFSFWFIGSALASALTAWLAFQIRLTGHAPELLFPIGVGLALGFALAAVIRYSGWSGEAVPGGRDLRWSVVAAIVCGLLVVMGQEFLAHLDRRRNYFDVQNRPEVPMFARLAAGEMPPPSFVADLRIDIRERGAARWSFDALATVLSAAIVVAWQLHAAAARTTLASPHGAAPTSLADPQQPDEDS